MKPRVPLTALRRQVRRELHAALDAMLRQDVESPAGTIPLLDDVCVRLQMGGRASVMIQVDDPGPPPSGNGAPGVAAEDIGHCAPSVPASPAA